jgi:hypothetical protein
MKRTSFKTFIGMLLAFPLDFVRLTGHAWQILIESVRFRLQWKTWEHPCVFCRDVNKSIVPRNMSEMIRYRNVWMIALLQPEIRTMYSRRRQRRIPVCHTDSGVVPSHVLRALLVCTLTTGIWLSLLYGFFF